jgi:hypothetical protein
LDWVDFLQKKPPNPMNPKNPHSDNAFNNHYILDSYFKPSYQKVGTLFGLDKAPKKLPIRINPFLTKNDRILT